MCVCAFAFIGTREHFVMFGKRSEGFGCVRACVRFCFGTRAHFFLSFTIDFVFLDECRGGGGGVSACARAAAAPAAPVQPLRRVQRRAGGQARGWVGGLVGG